MLQLGLFRVLISPEVEGVGGVVVNVWGLIFVVVISTATNRLVATAFWNVLRTLVTGNLQFWPPEVRGNGMLCASV